MSDARVKPSIHGLRISIASLLTLAACTPVAGGSVSEKPTSEVKPEPTAPEPFDPRPRALAPYQGGSSCNLVHDGDSLYWLLQGFEARSARPVSASVSTVLAAAPSTAATSMGAVLDCSRTRGTVMAVAADGSAPPRVVAETIGWPWLLEQDDERLYWIGYCDHGLWSVAKSGGEPQALELGGLSLIDVLAMDDRLLLADRFGGRSGIYSLEVGSGAPTLIAGGGRQPWLLGPLGASLIWAEKDQEGWSALAQDQAGAEPRVLGRFTGQPNDALVVRDQLFVLTGAALLRFHDGDRPSPIAAVEDYGDRGNLAAGDGWLYFANGRSGTISRVDGEGRRQEAQVGGEPCGVAVDDRYLYWLDRGRDRVARASLGLFGDGTAVSELIEPSEE